MGKSEQQIQDKLYTNDNICLGDKYTVYSLGATTINNLVASGVLQDKGLSAEITRKKPDVLVVDNNQNVVLLVEHKKPETLASKKQVEEAKKQEIHVAKMLGAKAFLITDGDKFYWYNPRTGNRLKKGDGAEFTQEFKPLKSEETAFNLLRKLDNHLTENNDVIGAENVSDPTGLALSVGKILKKLPAKNTKRELLTFYELFFFKYLSDVGVLSGTDSFGQIARMYTDDYKELVGGINEAEILYTYLHGPRDTLKALIPTDKDGAGIISESVFHAKKDVVGGTNYKSADNTDKIFKAVILEFVEFEVKYGKFSALSKSFKANLMRIFLKQSDSKATYGKFFTPQPLVESLVSMLDVRPGMEICDPTCGTGKYLTEIIKENGLYEYSGGGITKTANVIGYDKALEGQDDTTIRLAKANTLLQFIDLLPLYKNKLTVYGIVSELVNPMFHNYKNTLGTLSLSEPDKFDILVATLPCYKDTTVQKLAKDTGRFTNATISLETLFIKWLVDSLKPGGVATFIATTSVMTTENAGNLRAEILKKCNLEAILTLPDKTFYSAPKPTCIISIKKKHPNEYGNKQKYPVFCAITSSIGETLDSKREITEDNNLAKTIHTYKVWNANKSSAMVDKVKEFITEENKNIKLMSIDNFSSEVLIFNTFWSKEELTELGVIAKGSKITVKEFEDCLFDLGVTALEYVREVKTWQK